ncbi:hypothetical protein AB0L41_42630 [Amycolatopsis mediterranei]|uniref:hypothetical protein n=1 Tax=Amycolatopsis mediterranei TaxID=33910 RepID=UPI003434E15C
MHWWQFALLGAGGGALVEVLAIFKWLTVGQSARRTLAGRVKSKPPALRMYVDVPAHVWMAVLRAALGAGCAVLFGASGQINGPYVAVAVGFAAPSMLAQLGTIPQVAAAIQGPSKTSVPQSGPARSKPDGPVAEPEPHGTRAEVPSEQ